MDKTFLDQLVDFPAQVISKIASDKMCVALLLNKAVDSVTEDDFDTVLQNNLFNYQYVDDTTRETTAYVWAEVDVKRVQNQKIKDVTVYVTVACHKNYMKIETNIFKGLQGNRRDNITRYVDKILNGTVLMGLGHLTLSSVRTLTTINGFTIKELTYTVPDYNLKDNIA